MCCDVKAANYGPPRPFLCRTITIVLSAGQVPQYGGSQSERVLPAAVWMVKSHQDEDPDVALSSRHSNLCLRNPECSFPPCVFIFVYCCVYKCKYNII